MGDNLKLVPRQFQKKNVLNYAGNFQGDWSKGLGEDKVSLGL